MKHNLEMVSQDYNDWDRRYFHDLPLEPVLHIYLLKQYKVIMISIGVHITNSIEMVLY